MEAIRQIREVSTNQLIVTLPDYFLKQKVEIIILPINEIESDELKMKFSIKPIKVDKIIIPKKEDLHER